MSFDLETILGVLFVIFFVILPVFTKRKGGKPGQPGQPGGPAGPQSPRTGGSPQTAGQRGVPTASASPSSTTASSPQPQQPPAGGLQATLDEIRQRVQEAQLQERARAEEAARTSGKGRAAVSTSAAGAEAPSTGTTLGGSHSSSSADPFGRGMVSGQYTAQPSTSTTTRPGSQQGPSGAPRQAPSHRSGSPLGREGQRVGSLIESAAPLEVTRTKRARRRPSRQGPPGQDAPARRQTGASTAKLRTSYLGTTQADLVRGMIWHEVLAEPVAKRRLRRLRSRPR